MSKAKQAGFSKERLARIESHLTRKYIEPGRLPCAQVLIARKGEIIHQSVLGLRDVERGAKATDDTVFRIYSMTKPVTSVALMTLVEEGLIALDDPVAKHIPAWQDLRVFAAGLGPYATTPVARPMQVVDLLRHTSGLTYEFRGDSPIHQAYAEARVSRLKQTNADQADALAGLPLLHQPGTVWEYSRSTDVLGRLVEVISGQTLGVFLSERILIPLGMTDSGFTVPQADFGRIAEPFLKDPEGGVDVALLDIRRPAMFESGGGGMVSTAMDYARFLAMLHGNGRLGSVRLLGRKTIELMTSDHLGTIAGATDLLPPGHGFGLGFAVRTHAGMAPFPGSVGNYYWSGAAGTSFWVDPTERLYAVLMIQAPIQREYYRLLFRDMVYAALAD